jgi:alanyl-tRNA synthetase
MALFGEKYGDTVRVVIIDPEYSIELCGGTHVSATGELGFFKIKTESAIAAGVRRIEAIAGLEAEKYINAELKLLSSVQEQLKNPKDLLKSLEDLQSGSNNMRKRIESMEMKQVAQLKTELKNEAISIGKYGFIEKLNEDITPEALRKLGIELRQEIPQVLLVLATVSDGKPFVVIGIGDQLIHEKNLDAAKIVKEIVAPQIKGGGGGQKTLATAGGQDASALMKVISDVKALLA